MDEISTGLDSATTYSVAKFLSNTTHVMGLTTMIGLLQPPPEVYAIFDDVLLLTDGGQHLPPSALLPLALLCPSLTPFVPFSALPLPALPFPALPCFSFGCPALSCLALPFVAVLLPALPCPALPCPALPCPSLLFFCLPCPALPCCTFGCPALLCPAVLCLGLHCSI